MSEPSKALAKFRQSVRRLDVEAERGHVSQDAVNEVAGTFDDCWAAKKAELLKSQAAGESE
jgi:hypothetical protein